MENGNGRSSGFQDTPTITGWIKLHRQIRENPLWTDRPYARGQAWVDLLLRAAFQNTRGTDGCRVVQLTLGQMLTSERELALA